MGLKKSQGLFLQNRVKGPRSVAETEEKKEKDDEKESGNSNRKETGDGHFKITSMLKGRGRKGGTETASKKKKQRGSQTGKETGKETRNVRRILRGGSEKTL